MTRRNKEISCPGGLQGLEENEGRGKSKSKGILGRESKNGEKGGG